MKRIDEGSLRAKFNRILPLLDERQRRLLVAAEAASWGRGGTALVERASGVSRVTIHKGLKELDQPVSGKIRAPGAGRKESTDTQPGLLVALESLIEADSSGAAPLLRWTCQSTRQLASLLNAQGFNVSHQLVHRLLTNLEYRMQGNLLSKKSLVNPDRNAQFHYVAATASRSLAAGQPVLVVEMKRNYLVPVRDSASQEKLPEGDLDRDTALLAVESLSRWWLRVGRDLYPAAGSLMISADGGGLSFSWGHLWQLELAQLAQREGLNITVCHLPPGTTKWNGLQHQLFSNITTNWQGGSLVNHQVGVGCIVQKTNNGQPSGPAGEEVDDMGDNPKLRRHPFHGEWNYTLPGGCQKMLKSV